MKSLTTQILLGIAAVFFMIKGGFALMVAMWKIVLPIVFFGAAYYFGKKALLGGGKKVAAELNKNPEAGGVIEICPHCLSPVGSCPKCRKSRL